MGAMGSTGVAVGAVGTGMVVGAGVGAGGVSSSPPPPHAAKASKAIKNRPIINSEIFFMFMVCILAHGLNVTIQPFDQR